MECGPPGVQIHPHKLKREHVYLQTCCTRALLHQRVSWCVCSSIPAFALHYTHTHSSQHTQASKLMEYSLQYSHRGWILDFEKNETFIKNDSSFCDFNHSLYIYFLLLFSRSNHYCYSFKCWSHVQGVPVPPDRYAPGLSVL